VRGGDHRAAVQLARADQVVAHLRRDLPGVDHGGALLDQPLADAGGHLRAAEAHVAAQPDSQLGDVLAPESRQHPGEGAADQMGGLGVELLAVDAADVVGLEDPGRGRADCHGQPKASRTVA
jgi:hypothetical protein